MKPFALLLLLVLAACAAAPGSRASSPYRGPSVEDMMATGGGGGGSGSGSGGSGM